MLKDISPAPNPEDFQNFGDFETLLPATVAGSDGIALPTGGAALRALEVESDFTSLFTSSSEGTIFAKADTVDPKENSCQTNCAE